MKILRCLTLNIWGEQPPLERRMTIIVETLRNLRPDVVALQEVREIGGQLPNQAAEIGERAGYAHVFAPAISWGGGHEGLAILTREQLGYHDVLELPHANPDERRILLSGRMDTRFGAVWVHTTHLNYRLHHGRQREDQVMAIDEAVAARAGEVPQVVMGDFNSTPDADEIRWLRGLTTLGGRRVFYQDAWEVMHPGEHGYTWSKQNTFTERLKWLMPNRRLDYIFVTPMRRDGRGIIHTTRLVYDRADRDGVFASDHFGLQAEVQIEALAPLA